MKLKYLNQCLYVCLIYIWIDTANADLQISLHDQNNSPVENAVIAVYPTDSSIPSQLSEQQTIVIMDQRDRQFIPYVLPVRTGTPVNFPNSDNIRHQVYSFSPAKIFKLPLYHDVPSEPVVFDKPGVVILGCNIHDQMIAYIYVTDTEYFAKVENGHAVITGIPAGKYEVSLWHPSMRDSEAEKKEVVEIMANKPTTLSLSMELNLSADSPKSLTPFEQKFKDLLRETN